jgi:transcriptional regulator with XRE-family HTH domain
MDFATRVLELRKQRNIKQVDVANALGISVRSWQRYESNEREPTLSQLVKLADFFNVSLDYLVGRSDDPSPPQRRG